MGLQNVIKYIRIAPTGKEGGPQLFKIFALYFLLSVLAYAGIAFLNYSLKWDMLDCYLPWRYFVGESIQNGIFPFWNPYQHLGYPIHADLRSVFYPEALVVGLLGGYKVYTLHFLFIANISLAGLGMYLLAGHFTNNVYARMMAGMVYLLSGFFVSHGQEMFGIIAATWIPYILYFFIRLQHYRQWDDLWKLAFFLFLQLTGGYQALSIMLLYLLLVIFLTEAMKQFLQRNWPGLKRLLIQNVSLALIVLVSVLVLIVTYWQVAPQIGRFGGTSLADAQFMPFSPRSLISLILPFASVKDTAFFDTDLSMNNAYVGLLMLMFYLLAWFRKKSRLENIFWLFGLVFLFAAFGRYTPVREWLYDYAPLMNLFRMTAFFRYFAIISIILLGASEVGKMIEYPVRYFRKLSIVIALFAIVIAAFVLHARQFVDFETFNPGNFIFDLIHTLETSTRYEHMILHGLIQLLFLTLLIAGLLFVKKKGKGLVALLLIFTALEMTVAVRLNFPVTIGSHPKPAVIQQSLNKMPEGFPLPDLKVPLASNRDTKPALYPLWRNTNIYTKTVSADGFNSFRLDAFETFRSNHPMLFEASLKNPVMFLSDKAKPLSKLNDSLIEPKVIWVHDSIYATIKARTGNRQAGDTIVLKKFDPTHILCEVKITEAQVLTLMQTSYPGWQVYLNGNPVPHFTTNTLFISCLVPAGSNMVEFRYSNKPVMAGFLISYLVFGLIIFIIVYRSFKHSKGSKKAWWITGVLFSALIIVLIILITRIKTSDQKRLKAYKAIEKNLSLPGLITKPALLVLNVDSPDLMKQLIEPESNHTLYHRFSRKIDLVDFEKSLSRLVSDNDFNQLIFATYNLPYELEVEEIIRKYFPNLAGSKTESKAQVKLFNKQASRTPLFQTLNDLERHYPVWTGELLSRDSTFSFSGNFSWRLDGGNPGSPALVAAFVDLGVAGDIRIVASAKAWLTPDSDAALYVVVERDGKSIWQRTVRCSEMAERHETWTTIMLAAEPDFRPLPEDKLKVFFWIEGEKALWLDDFGVEIYKGSE